MGHQSNTWNLSDQFKQKVLDSFEDGLTAKEVSIKLYDDYLRETGCTLNRNICIGVKFRAGKCIKSNNNHNFSYQRKNKLYEELEGFVLRKCLCCHREQWIEENFRICTTCKQSESFRFASSIL
tara:strand:- start:129 stop:500 length:372 start_codon:yes stop_codon:yes gene_type:complete